MSALLVAMLEDVANMDHVHKEIAFLEEEADQLHTKIIRALSQTFITPIDREDILRINQEQYGLKMPFGHDTPPAGERYPTFMEDYRSGGTPWFTVIDPEGNVVHADFRLDPQRFLAALGADDVELKRA